MFALFVINFNSFLLRATRDRQTSSHFGDFVGYVERVTPVKK